MVKKNNNKNPEEPLTDRLERLLREEERRLEGETDPALRQTTARTVVLFASELRKAEAAARKSSEDLTRADVMEWFRTLSDTDADRLLREMTTQRKKGSGLA